MNEKFQNKIGEGPENVEKAWYYEPTPEEKELLKDLSYFLELKNSYENIKEKSENDYENPTYKEAQIELGLAESDLLNLTNKIAKECNETKNDVYSYDEIEIKLRELRKVIAANAKAEGKIYTENPSQN